MSVYSSKKSTLWQLVKLSIKHYPKTLYAAFIFIAFASLLQSFYLFTLPLTYHPWGYAILALLVSVYFGSGVIYSSHLALMQQRLSFLKRAWGACQKWPRIMVCGLLYAGIFTLMMYWLQLLTYLGTQWGFIGKAQGLWDLLLVGAPLLVVNLLLLLSFPLLIVTRDSFFTCLKKSCFLAWKCRLKAVFVLYFAMACFVYITMPTTVHAGWLIAYHVKVLFDLLAYLLLMPLITNYMLFLLNDLQID